MPLDVLFSKIPLPKILAILYIDFELTTFVNELHTGGIWH